MLSECGSSSGCSRPGCAGARLVPGDGGAALLAAEAELLQHHQQQQASQKPYRIGLILLCVGALFNWLGLAQAYVEPMRYIGVGCIVAGALLICAAMCRWLGRSGVAASAARHSGCEEASGEVSRGGVHVITLPALPPCSPGSEFQHGGKPPDYDSLVGELPSYEDAIKLQPPATRADGTSSCTPMAVPPVAVDVTRDAASTAGASSTLLCENVSKTGLANSLIYDNTLSRH